MKEQQLEIILRTNPCNDNFHLWIREIEDILTFDEALKDEENLAFTDDFTEVDAQKCLASGIVKVYSSYPIAQGVFVTPSLLEAKSYAGKTRPIYAKEVFLEDVAWLDCLQGQYAKVEGL